MLSFAFKFCRRYFLFGSAGSREIFSNRGVQLYFASFVKYSKVVSTEGSHQSKLGLVARRVRIIVLVHNNIHMRLTRLKLFVLLFNFVSLLDTLYIHFSVLVAWAVHSLLTELSA